MRAVVRTAVDGEADALDDALDGLPGVYAARLGRQGEEPCELLVAEVGGRPVGAGVLRWVTRDAAVRERLGELPGITDLQVHPDERGQGYGSALVLAACARAAAAGHLRVGIGVGEGNPDAARLYLRLGFAETGVACTDLDDVRYLVRELGRPAVG